MVTENKKKSTEELDEEKFDATVAGLLRALRANRVVCRAVASTLYFHRRSIIIDGLEDDPKETPLTHLSIDIKISGHYNRRKVRIVVGYTQRKHYIEPKDGFDYAKIAEHVRHRILDERAAQKEYDALAKRQEQIDAKIEKLQKQANKLAVQTSIHRNRDATHFEVNVRYLDWDQVKAVISALTVVSGAEEEGENDAEPAV